jgi:Tfp pilus assembly protein PilO
VLSSLNSKEKVHDGLQEKTSQKKEEWLKWQEAQKDMEELRAKYFYSDKQGLEQLRLDLQQVFDEAGIPVSPLKFNYSEFKKESVRKVEVTFSLRGSYSALRKFVHAVEKFPRFLVIERIDFLNIGPSGEAFDLRVTLAGYYAS